MPIIFLVFGSVFAGEPAHPLWDGSESVSDYAKRVNLPPTKTLDLGNGVKMELVLIPAGKFMMGKPVLMPEPALVDEDGFRKKIITGQVLLVASAVVLLVMFMVVVIRAVRQRRRPQLSLALLLAVTVAAGGCVLSGLHWRQSVQQLEKAEVESVAATFRFASAFDKLEMPAHAVTLTKPFYMGKFAVTQEQYQQVIGKNPSKFIGNGNPVDTVSWDDAQAYCKTLSGQANEVVRLPTEAEWEFACRAGTTTTYHSGDTEVDLAKAAWYSANSNHTTHAVGQKEPNGFGLYDMHGNVFQWCEDWYAENNYKESEVENPRGATQGIVRSMRGGSWSMPATNCRSVHRAADIPTGIDYSHFEGFRVVATAFRTQ